MNDVQREYALIWGANNRAKYALTKVKDALEKEDTRYTKAHLYLVLVYEQYEHWWEDQMDSSEGARSLFEKRVPLKEALKVAAPGYFLDISIHSRMEDEPEEPDAEIGYVCVGIPTSSKMELFESMEGVYR